MKNISIMLFICLFISICAGCTPALTEEHEVLSEAQQYIRLAENYQNWDMDAVGSLDFDKITDCPRVAVIDTGCNDLPEQIVADAGIDCTGLDDESGHGTTILKKLLSINPYMDIILIKLPDKKGNFSASQLARAIREAIDLDVEVIHMSLGIEIDDPEIKSAVDLAADRGIIMIAAAGNSADNITYPGAYEKVFSVMSRDINNWDLTLNGRNKDKLSFSAPGEHVLCDDKYVVGTSIAAVFITAAVSWLLGVDPDMSVDQIKQVLIDSCIYPNTYSYGIIQYEKLCKNVKTDA